MSCARLPPHRLARSATDDSVPRMAVAAGSLDSAIGEPAIDITQNGTSIVFQTDVGLAAGDVLGRVVEIASGQTYDQFLEMRVFGPLGMAATTYDGVTQRLYINGVQVANRAQTGLIAVSAGVLRIGDVKDALAGAGFPVRR